MLDRFKIEKVLFPLCFVALVKSYNHIVVTLWCCEACPKLTLVVLAHVRAMQMVVSPLRVVVERVGCNSNLLVWRGCCHENFQNN